MRRWLAADPMVAGRRDSYPAAAITPALWVGRSAQRLSARSLQRDIARLGREASIADLSPNQLRHTAATWWLQAGRTITEVSELLGHRLVETTRVYTRPNHQDLDHATAAAGAINP